jgi:TonB family protein
MIAPSARRRPRLGKPSPAPDELRLHLPPRRRPRWPDFLLSLAAIGAVTGAFLAGGELSYRLPGWQDEVQLVVAAPPPPPPKEIKEPPKPLPPPPREKAPPPPAAEPPPPPQFGLEKEAAGEKGDMAVATGNTLLKKSDDTVKPEPPPPPPEPLLLDQEAVPLEKVPAKYPEWAEEQGVTSRVLLMVTVDAAGRVVDARVEKSGGKDFDQAALEAIKATRYRPYVEKGRPLPVRFVVPYEFVL